jgi:hypothetical protein
LLCNETLPAIFLAWLARRAQQNLQRKTKLKLLIFVHVFTQSLFETLKSMTIGSQRLTDNQWTALISEWMVEQDKCSSPKELTALNRKRKCFVEEWCERNGVPIQHTSSLSRRLKHKQMVDAVAFQRKQQYFPRCGCIVDCKLIAAVEKKYGSSYKHHDYNEKLCINCNTKRFLQTRDYAADIFIEQHMNAKKGPVVNWPDAVAVTNKSLPVQRLSIKILACPKFIHFMKDS